MMIEKVKKNVNLKCEVPQKKIPTIMIMKINKNIKEEELIEEICKNNDLQKDSITVRLLPSNKKFNTNRATLKCREEDTIRLVAKNEIKIKFMIHPIKKLYNFVQCNKCYGFGHFAESKEGVETCSRTKKCAHCGEDDHVIEECSLKESKDRARCLNCKGNHRSNDRNCSKRIEILSKLKYRYIC
jgi:hypothetical protein